MWAYHAIVVWASPPPPPTPPPTPNPHPTSCVNRDGTVCSAGYTFYFYFLLLYFFSPFFPPGFEIPGSLFQCTISGQKEKKVSLNCERVVVFSSSAVDRRCVTVMGWHGLKAALRFVAWLSVAFRPQKP